ncbi:hypothetical protein SK128_027310, partial [Halocaridina rubra]
SRCLQQRVITGLLIMLEWLLVRVSLEVRPHRQQNISTTKLTTLDSMLVLLLIPVIDGVNML